MYQMDVSKAAKETEGKGKGRSARTVDCSKEKKRTGNCCTEAGSFHVQESDLAVLKAILMESNVSTKRS